MSSFCCKFQLIAIYFFLFICNVKVTDDIEGVKNVILNYTTGNGTWLTMMMPNSIGDYFNATIPSFQNGTNIVYMVIAEDNASNSLTTQQLGFDLQYTVIPEFPSTTLLMMLILITIFASAVIHCRRGELT